MTAIPAKSSKVLLQYLRIPVLEDSKTAFRLTPRQRAELMPGTPLVVRFEDILAAHEAHWRITDMPENPAAIVEIQKQHLRDNLDAFWEIRPNENSYGRKVKPVASLTSEHDSKTGELIAEGLAVHLVTTRLRVPRSQVYFIKPKGGGRKKGVRRPDYLLVPEYAASIRAIRGVGHPICKIEVRSRKLAKEIPASHATILSEKKASASVTPSPGIAVYCSYGFPGKDPARRTQIILGDPVDEAEMPSVDDLHEVVLRHYLGVTARLGLWDLEAALVRQLGRFRKWKLERPYQLDDAPKISTLLRPREIRGRQYLGRVFSILMTRVELGDLTPAEGMLQFERDGAGQRVYHGLDLEVVEMIRESNISALARFSDGYVEADANERIPSGLVYTGDGVIRSYEEISDPTEQGEVFAVLFRRFERWHQGRKNRETGSDA